MVFYFFQSPLKGLNNPYNPHNFDEFFAQEYGGWGEGPKGGRFPPMGRGPMPPMRPGGPPPIGRGPMMPGMGPSGPPPFRGRGPFSNPRGPHPMRNNQDDDYNGHAFMNGNSPINGNVGSNSPQVDKVSNFSVRP